MFSVVFNALKSAFFNKIHRGNYIPRKSIRFEKNLIEVVKVCQKLRKFAEVANYETKLKHEIIWLTGGCFEDVPTPWCGKFGLLHCGFNKL